jgi:integrase
MPLLTSLLEVVRATVSWQSPRIGGTVDPMAQRTAPTEGAVSPSLKDDIAAYRHDLVRRGFSSIEAQKSVSIVELMAEKTEARTARGLELAAIMDFLTIRSTERGWGPKTHDNNLQRLRDFGTFLVERGRLQENLFLKIRKVRREKTVYGGDNTGSRAFTLEEQRAVIRVAEDAVDYLLRNNRACNHRDRCYRLFGLTGLRHLEMKRLPWCDVYIDAPPFHIKCSAKWTKSKRWDEIPLNREAVQILRDQRKVTGGQPLVWESVPSLETLNADMREAGVAKVDARGRHAGYHSFRKGLNTQTRLNKTDPDIRRKLLRHEDLSLTMGAYSDVVRAEMERAVECLQRLGEPEDVETDLSTSSPRPPPNRKNDLTERGEMSDSMGGASASPHSHNSDRRQAPGPVDHSRMHQQPRTTGFGPVCGPASGGAVQDPQHVWGDETAGIGGSNPPPSAFVPRYARDTERPRHEVLDLVEALIAGLFAFRERLEQRRRQAESVAHGSEECARTVPARKSRPRRR